MSNSLCVSQYEATPTTTNNINYKKQHKNIEAQVHLTKGQNDRRQSDRETKRERTENEGKRERARQTWRQQRVEEGGGALLHCKGGNKNQAKGKCSLDF